MFSQRAQLRKCELECVRGGFSTELTCLSREVAGTGEMAGGSAKTFICNNCSNPALHLQTTTPVFELTLDFHCCCMYFHLDLE